MKKMINSLLAKYGYVKSTAETNQYAIRLCALVKQARSCRIVVQSWCTEQYDEYSNYSHYIDFTGSYLHTPNHGFFVRFCSEIEKSQAVLSKMSTETLFSELVLDRFDVLMIVEEFKRRIEQDSSFYPILVQNQDKIPTRCWSAIFRYIQLPSRTLLELEKSALEHLPIVCAFQKLNKPLKVWWRDYPGFMSKKRAQHYVNEVLPDKILSDAVIRMHNMEYSTLGFAGGGGGGGDYPYFTNGGGGGQLGKPDMTVHKPGIKDAR